MKRHTAGKKKLLERGFLISNPMILDQAASRL
jgi:hypothetical protein